jgi:hypothetical protein
VTDDRTTGELAKDPLQDSEESKEITDKIHRLVRRFSRDLVELIYQELGARKVVVKGKPGPKPGFVHKRRPCPICLMNENNHRRYGFICKDCRAGKEIGHRTKMKEVFRGFKKWKKKDPSGRDFKVTLKKPKVLKAVPVQPKEVEIEDVEPDFLDRLIEVVEEPQVKAAVEPKKPSSDDVDFFS